MPPHRRTLPVKRHDGPRRGNTGPAVDGGTRVMTSLVHVRPLVARYPSYFCSGDGRIAEPGVQVVDLGKQRPGDRVNRDPRNRSRIARNDP